MKKSGIIHAELASWLARLRHTDLFVVADSGLPVPVCVPVIDLAFSYGMPSFNDVASCLLAEVVVQAGWVASEIDAANPECAAFLAEWCPKLDRIAHEELKARVGRAAFVVRTGEARPFANVLLQAGVPF